MSFGLSTVSYNGPFNRKKHIRIPSTNTDTMSSSSPSFSYRYSHSRSNGDLNIGTGTGNDNARTANVSDSNRYIKRVLVYMHVCMCVCIYWLCNQFVWLFSLWVIETFDFVRALSRIGRMMYSHSFLSTYSYTYMLYMRRRLDNLVNVTTNQSFWTDHQVVNHCVQWR